MSKNSSFYDIIIYMKKIFAQNLIDLAQKLPSPLYAVGGVVRDFLIDGSISNDIDLGAPIPSEQLILALQNTGFKVVAEYKRTGTVMFTDGKIRYEYTAFRREKYIGGIHTPIETEFTEDIKEDALRRDFKCNAVYYDLKNYCIVDPLGGVNDIKNRTLDTVTYADQVFSCDGLRLMRLARFAGELDFRPTPIVLNSAKKFADNITDISPERIFNELTRILQADTAHSFSDKCGHYTGLKILDDTRVLDRIFPELAEGRGMAQRADFHRYDVLEHGLRCVLYAGKSIRLGALMHDIGKPYCFKRDGYYYHHFEEGEKIVEKVLKRIKADNATIAQVKFLVKEHMVDLDCSMKENKVRRFIVKNQDRLDELLMVKQADFRASLETESTAPTLIKWGRIYSAMKADGTPFSLKELKISASDLIEIGFKDREIGKELKKLWDDTIIHPERNVYELLMRTAEWDYYKRK